MIISISATTSKNCLSFFEIGPVYIFLESIVQLLRIINSAYLQTALLFHRGNFVIVMCIRNNKVATKQQSSSVGNSDLLSGAALFYVRTRNDG